MQREIYPRAHAKILIEEHHAYDDKGGKAFMKVDWLFKFHGNKNRRFDIKVPKFIFGYSQNLEIISLIPIPQENCNIKSHGRIGELLKVGS
jgi:hypothetical protein